jgi:hypothetical protein
MYEQNCALCSTFDSGAQLHTFYSCWEYAKDIHRHFITVGSTELYGRTKLAIILGVKYGLGESDQAKQ